MGKVKTRVGSSQCPEHSGSPVFKKRHTINDFKSHGDTGSLQVKGSCKRPAQVGHTPAECRRRGLAQLGTCSWEAPGGVCSTASSCAGLVWNAGLRARLGRVKQGPGQTKRGCQIKSGKDLQCFSCSVITVRAHALPCSK